MFTSYYGNLKKILAEHPELEPVAISQGIPFWYGKRRKDQRLAPYWEMLEAGADACTRGLEAAFRRLDPKEVYDSLGENAVLLCWEKPGYRCHRRLVAEWLEKALGVTITELGFERSKVPAFTKMPPKPASRSR
jgi:hypothetical protein